MEGWGVKNLKRTPELDSRYIKDIMSFKSLTRADEQALGRRAHTGDVFAVRQTLVLHNLRLVLILVQRYRNSGVSLDDLMQQGSLGLMRAAEKFDYRRGVRFRTYATLWIRQAMERFIDGCGHTVHVPSYLRKMLRRANRAGDCLRKVSDSEPTISAIASDCGLTESNLLDLLAVVRRSFNFNGHILDGEFFDSSENQIKDMRGLTPIQMLEAKEELELSSLEVVSMVKLLEDSLGKDWQNGRRPKYYKIKSYGDVLAIFIKHYGLNESCASRRFSDICEDYNVGRERARQLVTHCWTRLLLSGFWRDDLWLKSRLERIKELEIITGIVSPVWAYKPGQDVSVISKTHHIAQNGITGKIPESATV